MSAPKTGRVVELERLLRRLRRDVMAEGISSEDEARIGDEIRRAKRRLADARRQEGKTA